jgi:hypothetical protein
MTMTLRMLELLLELPFANGKSPGSTASRIELPENASSDHFEYIRDALRVSCCCEKAP